MRVFIALPLPGAYQDGLAALVRELSARLRSRLSWTKPGNWHLTLKFLGDMPEARADQVAGALTKIAWQPFTLRAGGGGFFPDERKPRVLWTALASGSDESAGLAAKVVAALEPLGMAQEKRPFRAHLTLGRVKQNEGDDWRGVLETIRATDWPPVVMDEFALYKSDLSAAGPAYTSLARFPASGRSSRAGGPL